MRHTSRDAPGSPADDGMLPPRSLLKSVDVSREYCDAAGQAGTAEATKGSGAEFICRLGTVLDDLFAPSLEIGHPQGCPRRSGRATPSARLAWVLQIIAEIELAVDKHVVERGGA